MYLIQIDGLRNVHTCVCIEFLIQFLKQKNVNVFCWDGSSEIRNKKDNHANSFLDNDFSGL